jgi:diadenosine tetraphosphate (Ap4A) HIT family hydrolase
MICPKTHRRTVFDLTADEWTDTHLLLPRIRTAIDERVSPDGYNVGWNVMRAGGQTIDTRIYTSFHGGTTSLLPGRV